jgi:hypothetical protein
MVSRSIFGLVFDEVLGEKAKRGQNGEQPNKTLGDPVVKKIV